MVPLLQLVNEAAGMQNGLGYALLMRQWGKTSDPRAHQTRLLGEGGRQQDYRKLSCN